jgi:hypothetical protein
MLQPTACKYRRERTPPPGSADRLLQRSRNSRRKRGCERSRCYPRSSGWPDLSPKPQVDPATWRCTQQIQPRVPRKRSARDQFGLAYSSGAVGRSPQPQDTRTHLDRESSAVVPVTVGRHPPVMLHPIRDRVVMVGKAGVLVPVRLGNSATGEYRSGIAGRQPYPPPDVLIMSLRIYESERGLSQGVTEGNIRGPPRVDTPSPCSC